MTPIAPALGDHFAACPRTGLLRRRGFVLQRAWVHVLREAVGPEGRVVPQQWLANTTVRAVAADDRKRLGFVVYGATLTGTCGATLDSFFTQAGQPSSGSANRDGAMPEVARRRKVACYPELCRGGPQRLCVFAVGGRWNEDSLRLVKHLDRLRSKRAPPALRASTAQGWAPGVLLLPRSRKQLGALLWARGPCPVCHLMEMTSPLPTCSNSRIRRLPVGCLRESER